MVTPARLFEETLVSRSYRKNPSPLRILAILVVIIFQTEIITTIIMYFLGLRNYVVETLVDALIMVLLIIPALYLFQLHPLMKEIRERTQAEQALRSSGELLRKVLELLPVGVWITDQDGKVVHGNPASRHIWGELRYVDKGHYGEYKAWWVNNRKPVEPEDWAVSKAIRQQATVLNEEVEIESFDGARKIILNSAVPILDQGKNVQGAIVVNQDITELRQAERAIRQTNELLERFFFSIDTLIAYMDRDFNFIRVNDTYAKSGGHPAEFYTGKNHFELFPNPENQAIFAQVVECGEPFSVREKAFEYAEHPEWGISYWDWCLQPVKSSDGRVEGVVLSLVDVSERKRAELKLERQNLELRQLSEAEHKQRKLAESLANATIILNKSLELDEVLCSILEQIRKIIPFQGGDIMILDGKRMRVAGYLGFEDHPESQNVLEGAYNLEDYPVLQRVCETLQPVVIDAVKDDTSWRAAPGMAWVCSYIAVPLIYKDEVIGIINLTSELPGAFSRDAASRLQTFAAPAASALQNARLFEAETNARRAAETLSAAAQALTQTLDLEQVANTLLDHVQGILHPDVSGVALLRDESGISVIAARGVKGWADWDEPFYKKIDEVIDDVVHRLKLERRSVLLLGGINDQNDEAFGEFSHIQKWLAVPVIASDKVIGVVGLGRVSVDDFPRQQTEWAEALVGQAGVAIQNAWLFEQVRSSSDRLQSLARKLVEIQENERYHIARELHDQAGQALSSLKLSLGQMEQDLKYPPAMRQRLAEMMGLADYVLEDLHRLAMDLRPAALDHLGLVAALEQFAKNFQSEKLSVQFKVVGAWEERLPKDLETSLYRIVQEALTNIVRHAQASHAAILLRRDDKRVVVIVEDDGVGFIPDQTEIRGRLGLVGMHERAEMLGGTLTVESTPEQGTSVIVEVPDVYSYSHRG